jgi:hypothetical protein
MGCCVCQLAHTTAHWHVGYVNWHTQHPIGMLCMPIGIHNSSLAWLLCMSISIHNNPSIGLVCMPIGIHYRHGYCVSQLAYTACQWVIVYANWHTQQPASQWVSLYANWHTQQPIRIHSNHVNGLWCMPNGIHNRPLDGLLCMLMGCCVCQLAYTAAQPIH